MSVVQTSASSADKLGDVVKLWVESTAGADQKAWSVGVRNMRNFMRLLASPELSGYSLGNQILIAIQAEQMPVYPSRLATMYQWASIGREPVRGSRSVRIYMAPERPRGNPNIHDTPIAENGGCVRLFDILGLQDAGQGKLFNSIWPGDSIPQVGGTIPKSVKISACENNVYTIHVTRLIGGAEVTEQFKVTTPVEIVRAVTGAAGASTEDIRSFLDQSLGLMGRNEQSKKEVTHVFDVSQTVVSDKTLEKEFPFHLAIDRQQAHSALTAGGYAKAGDSFLDSIDSFVEKEFRGEDAQNLTESAHPLIKHYVREIALVATGAKGWQDVDAKPLSRGGLTASDKPQFLLSAIRQSWLHLSHKLELTHLASRAIPAVENAAIVAPAKQSLNVPAKQAKPKLVAPKLAAATTEEKPEVKPVAKAVTVKTTTTGAPKFSPFGSTLAKAKMEDRAVNTVVVKQAEPKQEDVVPAIKKPAFNPFARKASNPVEASSPNFG